MSLNILQMGLSPAGKLLRCPNGQPCNILKVKREVARGKHTSNFIAFRRYMAGP